MEKNKIMMIAIIVLLISVIGAVVGVGVMVVKSLGADKASIEEEAPEYANISHSELTLVNIDGPISTNLLTGVDEIPHTVKLDLSIGVVNTKETLDESLALLSLLETKKVVIKSIILDTVKRKTYEEIMQTSAKGKLQNEIKRKLQIEFGTNLIYNVEIFEFIAI